MSLPLSSSRASERGRMYVCMCVCSARARAHVLHTTAAINLARRYVIPEAPPNRLLSNSSHPVAHYAFEKPRPAERIGVYGRRRRGRMINRDTVDRTFFSPQRDDTSTRKLDDFFRVGSRPRTAVSSYASTIGVTERRTFKSRERCILQIGIGERKSGDERRLLYRYQARAANSSVVYWTRILLCYTNCLLEYYYTILEYTVWCIV